MVAMKLHARLAMLSLAAALAVSTPARTQQPALHDPLLDHFIGSWVLTGTIGKKSTTHDITAEWVLGHHYVHLHEVSREKLPSGEPEYEAEVYLGWQPRTAQYGCVWLDVYGNTTPSAIATAPRNGNQLAFVFADKESGDFHTTFEYKPATDTWAWRMDQESGGTLSPFARLTMTRAK